MLTLFEKMRAHRSTLDKLFHMHKEEAVYAAKIPLSSILRHKVNNEHWEVIGHYGSQIRIKSMVSRTTCLLGISVLIAEFVPLNKGPNK